MSNALGHTITLTEGTEITTTQQFPVKKKTKILVWQEYKIYEIVNSVRVTTYMDIFGKKVQVSDKRTPLPPVQMVQTLDNYCYTTYPELDEAV